MIKKSMILKALEEFPEEIAVDDLIDRLLFLEKVERGLQQIDEGRTVSHDEVKAEMEQWLK